MKILEEKIELGYKRMSLVVVILSIIPIPFIFLLKNSELFYFVIFEFIWIIISILFSYKIVMTIWK